MPSANFDNLHVLLSRKIKDPIASGSELNDGVEISSTLRTDYLNRANKFIQLAVWQIGGNLFVSKYLSGLKKTQSFTWATAGVTVASDYHYWLEAQEDGPPVIILTYHPSLLELDAFINPNLADAFTIDAGKTIIGFNATARLNTPDTGKMFYIGNDTRAQAQDTNDITIDPLWFDSVVEIAASFHLEEKDELQSAVAIITRWKIISTILANRMDF